MQHATSPIFAQQFGYNRPERAYSVRRLSRKEVRILRWTRRLGYGTAGAAITSASALMIKDWRMEAQLFMILALTIIALAFVKGLSHLGRRYYENRSRTREEAYRSVMRFRTFFHDVAERAVPLLMSAMGVLLGSIMLFR